MDQTAPVRQLAATTALGRPMQRRPRPAQRSAARDVAPLAQPGAPPGARPPRPPTTNVVGPDRDDQTTEGPTDSSASLTSSRLRSEEHTSELQSLTNLVCRLLLEKKK